MENDATIEDGRVEFSECNRKMLELVDTGVEGSEMLTSRVTSSSSALQHYSVASSSCDIKRLKVDAECVTQNVFPTVVPDGTAETPNVEISDESFELLEKYMDMRGEFGCGEVISSLKEAAEVVLDDKVATDDSQVEHSGIMSSDWKIMEEENFAMNVNLLMNDDESLKMILTMDELQKTTSNASLGDQGTTTGREISTVVYGNNDGVVIEQNSSLSELAAVHSVDDEGTEPAKESDTLGDDGGADVVMEKESLAELATGPCVDDTGLKTTEEKECDTTGDNSDDCIVMELTSELAARNVSDGEQIGSTKGSDSVGADGIDCVTMERENLTVELSVDDKGTRTASQSAISLEVATGHGILSSEDIPFVLCVPQSVVSDTAGNDGGVAEVDGTGSPASSSRESSQRVKRAKAARKFAVPVKRDFIVEQ